MCPLVSTESTTSPKQDSFDEFISKTWQSWRKKEIEKNSAKSFYLETREKVVKYLDRGEGVFSSITQPGPLVELALYEQDSCKALSDVEALVEMHGFVQEQIAFGSLLKAGSFHQKIHFNCSFLYGSINSYYTPEKKYELMRKLAHSIDVLSMTFTQIDKVFTDRFKFCEKMKLLPKGDCLNNMLVQVSCSKFKTLYDEQGNVEFVDDQKAKRWFYIPKTKPSCKNCCFSNRFVEKILLLLEKEMETCSNCFVSLHAHIVFAPLEAVNKALIQQKKGAIIVLDNESLEYPFSKVIPFYPLNTPWLYIKNLETRDWPQNFPKIVRKDLQRFLGREPFFQRTTQLLDVDFPWRLYQEEKEIRGLGSVNFVFSHLFYFVRLVFLTSLPEASFDFKVENSCSFFFNLLEPAVINVLKSSKQKGILLENKFNKENKKTVLLLDVSFLSGFIKEKVSYLQEKEYLKRQPREPSTTNPKNERAYKAKARLQQKLLAKTKDSSEEITGAYAFNAKEIKHITKSLSYEEKQEALKAQTNVYYAFDKTFKEVDQIGHPVLKKKKLILMDLTGKEEKDSSEITEDLFAILADNVRRSVREDFTEEEKSHSLAIGITVSRMLCDEEYLEPALKSFNETCVGAASSHQPEEFETPKTKEDPVSGASSSKTEKETSKKPEEWFPPKETTTDILKTLVLPPDPKDSSGLRKVQSVLTFQG